MRLLTKQCLTPHMVSLCSGDAHNSCVGLFWSILSMQPCVVVKQLTLDIEHYLGETVRTCADWGHRYLSFTDYDIQIVEVRLRSQFFQLRCC